MAEEPPTGGYAIKYVCKYVKYVLYATLLYTTLL